MTKKKTKDARDTLFGFAAYLYRNDPLISNSKALAAIKKKFPKSRTSMHSLRALRSRLRKEGLRIPYQREGVGKFFEQEYVKDTNLPIVGEPKNE